MLIITYSLMRRYTFGKGRRDMERKEELLKVIEHDPTLSPLIDEVIFLEGRLETLKKLPFLRVNPKNPEQQKSTPAQKQYKELLQQYVNIIRTLIRATGTDETDEESPLRKWVKSKSWNVMDDIKSGKGLKPLC